MANDDESNPAIPAWQRSRKQQQSTETSSTTTENCGQARTSSNGEIDGEDVEIPTPAEPLAVAAAEELNADDTTPVLQLQHMQTFLEDPAVKAASEEKKRAFFESKGISKEQIDRALKQEQQSALNVDDFQNFQQTQPRPNTATRATPVSLAATSAPPPAQRQQESVPPIITYPEFLVEAHKPPPLITPGRIVNTAYVVGGLAAILYGASKFLVQPMSDSLSEARHDFAQHSQSKVDEMNEKLSQLVSNIPESKKSSLEDEKALEDDDQSETSDPTELYHRDMGTQTSPNPTRRSSLSSSDNSSVEKKDNAARSTEGLNILRSHLNDMLSQTSDIDTANSDKQKNLEKLKDYLDSLVYSNHSAYGMWGGSMENSWSDVGVDGKKDGKAERDDVVEELKKEIRAVKGVLLSAKRFPGVTGRVGA